MSILRLFRPIFQPFTAFVSSIIFAIIIAFYGVILHWPQNENPKPVKVNITNGASLADISVELASMNIISNETVFVWAVKLLGYETGIPAGRFTLDRAKSNYDIIQQLKFGSPQLIKVTLLEGWTVEKSVSKLADKLQVSKSRLLTLSKDGYYARKLGVQAETLEGFLFPETYYFFEGESPENILSKIVGEYEKTIRDTVRRHMRELSMSELEIITLASIIEGEALHDSERPIISAVYHNRLKRGMRLQADPTIQYIIDDSPRRLLNSDLKIESVYNTYLHYGLPPGPINNPGESSIISAIYPADNDYLYFVARGDGYHSFSRTQKEHNQAKYQFQHVRRQVRRAQKPKTGS